MSAGKTGCQSCDEVQNAPDLQWPAGDLTVRWGARWILAQFFSARTDSASRVCKMKISQTMNKDFLQQMPAAGESAFWKYKAICLQADQRRPMEWCHQYSGCGMI
jgi:hypothetical protein